MESETSLLLHFSQWCQLLTVSCITGKVGAVRAAPVRSGWSCPMLDTANSSRLQWPYHRLSPSATGGRLREILGKKGQKKLR